MIDFKKIELSDMEVLREIFTEYPSRRCDGALGSTVMWRDYFDNHYALIDDTLILTSYYEDCLSFTYPIGAHPEKMLDLIDEYCEFHHIKKSFVALSNEQKDALLDRYPGSDAEFNRDWSDYLYDAQAIKNLVGKAYAQQRNQIHRFDREYAGNFRFESISSSNLNDVIEFQKAFKFHAEKDTDSADEELKICLEVLDNYNLYALKGGVLYVNDDVVAYTIAEQNGDTLFIHIEKANVAYKGVYQKLTNLFLQNNVDESVRYVNREEDTGDPGLRRSKMSYNPIRLLEKFTLTAE